MNFITFSEKDLNAVGKYMSFNQSHLLISIRNPKDKVIIPKSHYCKETLILEFNDVEDIDNEFVCFNYDMAVQVLDFVNRHCNMVSAIVVQCGAGVSRSVAVASALSKIINHSDDQIFSSGIPNMLTYLTLLDAYFMDANSDKKWSSIYYLRNGNMLNKLGPVLHRIWEYKLRKRSEKGEK